MHFKWNSQNSYNNTYAFGDVISHNAKPTYKTDKQILQDPGGVHTADALHAICRTLAEITDLIEQGHAHPEVLAMADLLYKK